MKTKTATSKTDVTGHQGESWLYTEIVKDHFFHPRNIFHTDKEAEIYEKKADGIGQVGSPACGDVMKLYIKVDKKTNKIKECRWKTFGCASAIASTSIMSEMAIGKTLEEAKKITPQDIVKALGGLPTRKIHCSVLGDQALRAAIEDYEKKKN
jgi:NifU-like protein involved in Fe-S cluster formation